MTEASAMDWLRDWWPIVSTIALGALAWAMLYLRSQFVTLTEHEAEIAGLRAQIDAMRAQLQRDEGRIDQTPTREQFAMIASKVERVEMTLQFLPDKDAVHRLEVSVAALHGELKEVAAQMKPVGAIADRLQEFLLEKARRA